MVDLFISLFVARSSLFRFFFSSRRRHTRSLCDWSSDVCSSDLAEGLGDTQEHVIARRVAVGIVNDLELVQIEQGHAQLLARAPAPVHLRLQTVEEPAPVGERSEERRVGKECRSRWWPYRERRKV